ncbi:MAG: sigma-70 family RNA polymerase sigma factor [Pyrinomonadaceae bacterium]|nr:sigma-70 family RNA polymerase sigma factor [Pyrinomonadaceae bacterium]
MSEQSQKRAIAEKMVDREELVEKYRYFVYSIVKKVRATLHRHVDFEELVSYGMIGLMEAADRFDPTRGISFTTFSYYRIRGAVFDGLRQMGVLMRSNKGKWVQKEANLNDLVQTASDDSTGKRGVDAEISEVGALVDRIIPAYLLSLSDESTPEVVDSKELPSETAETKGLISLVRSELTKMDDRERLILENLYFKGITTTALAKEMGVTKSWVSRLHSKAIAKLRGNLVDMGVLPKRE